MNKKITATIAVALMAMVVFAAVGATTYSWFSDSDETDITITTAGMEISTEWGTPVGNTCGDSCQFRDHCVPDRF